MFLSMPSGVCEKLKIASSTPREPFMGQSWNPQVNFLIGTLDHLEGMMDPKLTEDYYDRSGREGSFGLEFYLQYITTVCERYTARQERAMHDQLKTEHL